MKKTELQKSRARWQARLIAIRKKMATAKEGTKKYLELIKEEAKATSDYGREVAPWVGPLIAKLRQEGQIK
jgi:hypothetical protein